MAKRKETPDVLAEILGGEPPAQLDAPITRPPVAARRPPAKVAKTPAPTRPATPRKWEYLLVSFQNYQGWRPRFHNGRELDEWIYGPLIHEHLHELAEAGWELTAACAGEHVYGSADKYQLYFRRPLS
ncbi:MAG: hypothetical protein H6Q38_481 [Chloroflexi bacterium]|jgi:hypothetical protein|nr:hypothetical protein [Chloroflexota bacterium]